MNSGTPAICLTVRRWVGIVPGFAANRISSVKGPSRQRAGPIWSGEPDAETIEDIKDRNDESRVLRPRWPVRLGPQCNEHGNDAVVLVDDDRP
jgi:hypothetical protein